MKKITLLGAMLLLSMMASAQNATNSPYSQYGYGVMADQANGASVAMGGLAQGWRQGNMVNFSNPASYSGTDSLTLVFDAGLSLQITNFQEGARKVNAQNSSFDYVLGAFRLFPRVGVAFGLMPYSNVGYSYSDTRVVGESSPVLGENATTSSNVYAGSGGIHQVFVGTGIEVLRTSKTRLSLGANLSYVWGDYSKSVVNSYSDESVKTLSKYYLADVKSYKLDAALQLQQKLGKKDELVLGATYTFGHDMSSDPKCLVISNNKQTAVSDTATYTAKGELAMPSALALGVVWNHNERLRIGFDYKYEKWADVKYPVYQVVNNTPMYTMTEGLFTDRHKYIVGAEYCSNPLSRSWTGRVRYRMGLSYSTPYLRINNMQGPKEYGISAGIGMPIMNVWNGRSMLNVSASWVRTEATGLIKENTFRINVGLTFNERWFAKWQAQ